MGSGVPNSGPDKRRDYRADRVVIDLVRLWFHFEEIDGSGRVKYKTRWFTLEALRPFALAAATGTDAAMDAEGMRLIPGFYAPTVLQWHSHHPPKEGHLTVREQVRLAMRDVLGMAAGAYANGVAP